MVGMMVGDLKPIDVGGGSDDGVEEIGAEDEDDADEMQKSEQEQKAASGK